MSVFPEEKSWKRPTAPWTDAPMEKFFVITNAQKDPELTVTRGIKEYLEEKGKTCLIS